MISVKTSDIEWEETKPAEGGGWRERLQFEVMEDYINCAKLLHAAKDQRWQYAELRGHFGKLVSFIDELLTQAHENARREALEQAEKAFFGFEERTRRKDRAILYTDTISGKQTLRDDLWAVSSDELVDLHTELITRLNRNEGETTV